MASSKIQDLSRQEKNLRLRIAASDLSVSRLSRAFQASKCIISYLIILQCPGFTPQCACALVAFMSKLLQFKS